MDHKDLARTAQALESTPCQADPELWYGTPEEQNDAARYCKNCPALSACANYIATNPEQWGTWAGITEQARRPKVGRPPKTLQETHHD